MERWERRRIKDTWNERILFSRLSCFAIFPLSLFFRFSGLCKNRSFFPAKILSIRGEWRQKDSRRGGRGETESGEKVRWEREEKRCKESKQRRREKRGERAKKGGRGGRERERILSEWSFLCSLICQPMPFVFQPRTSRWK